MYKAYGEKPVLHDISLRFPATRISCLMAPSGAGKTTLLRILMGLETCDAGTVSGLDGGRIAPVFRSRIRRREDARSSRGSCAINSCGRS